MELEHCLKLLKNATSDTERMAGLMVVAKMIKSDEIGADQRKRIYNTVGFTFINRLLATSELPEGCVENPYHKIAVTMLACFCTDPQLALHPQLTSKIPQFNNFIQTKVHAEGCTLAEDSLQCLRALSCSPAGVQYLLKYQSIQALAQAYLVQNQVSDEAKEIMLSVLGALCAKEREGPHLGVLSDIVCTLAQEFRSIQDELKFKICNTLSSILLMAGNLLEGSQCDSWLKELSVGLADIFSSKLDPTRKQCALRLSAVLSQMFGIEWAIRNGPKFLLLWLHLVVVEVRLAVEDKDLGGIAESSSLLCSCFMVLECAIVHVSQHSEEDSNPQGSTLHTETLLQLHTVLTEALTFVVQLLATAANYIQQTTPSPSGVLAGLLQDYPIVTAAVRVLGAWLAEDSLTLSADVYSILPFLMDLCTPSSPQQPDGDLLKFLLPGLCHMTVDDKARPVLIQAKLGAILSSYMLQLFSMCEGSSEVKQRLCLCCGVVMNVCVSAPEVIKKDSDNSFATLTSLMIKIFTNKSSEGDPVLIMNAVTLFLMLTRRKGEMVPDARLVEVWRSVLKHLLCVLASCPCQRAKVMSANWDGVAELWFIAVQELSSLTSGYDLIKSAAADCAACQQLTEILSTLSRADQKDDEFEAIQGSLCTLLQTLA